MDRYGPCKSLYAVSSRVSAVSSLVAGSVSLLYSYTAVKQTAIQTAIQQLNSIQPLQHPSGY